MYRNTAALLLALAVAGCADASPTSSPSQLPPTADLSGEMVPAPHSEELEETQLLEQLDPNAVIDCVTERYIDKYRIVNGIYGGYGDAVTGSCKCPETATITGFPLPEQMAGDVEIVNGSEVSCIEISP